jgi:hypothetical protein
MNTATPTMMQQMSSSTIFTFHIPDIVFSLVLIQGFSWPVAGAIG